MTSTRRQFAWTLTAATGAIGVFAAAGALAQDDDAPPPNVFISPCGRPYRAPQAAPLP